MSAKFEESASHKLVVALFPDRNSAERAINDLKGAGFRGDQIGVALRNESGEKEMAQKTGTKAAEGAATGAVGGGVLGGVAGFLTGIGALTIPGIGPIIAGGVLATTLAGAGIGAAGGGLVGALAGMGLPEERARYFETGFKQGKVLVTVTPGNRFTDAEDILRRDGGDLGVTSKPRY